MDGLLLHCLDLQRVQLLVKHLAEIHDDALVDLLPQVSPEDLNEGDLQRGDLAVHEDAGEVELHLEAHIHLWERNTRKRFSGRTNARIVTRLRRGESHRYVQHRFSLRWLC